MSVSPKPLFLQTPYLRLFFHSSISPLCDCKVTSLHSKLSPVFALQLPCFTLLSLLRQITGFSSRHSALPCPFTEGHPAWSPFFHLQCPILRHAGLVFCKPCRTSRISDGSSHTAVLAEACRAPLPPQVARAPISSDWQFISRHSKTTANVTRSLTAFLGEVELTCLPTSSETNENPTRSRIPHLSLRASFAPTRRGVPVGTGPTLQHLDRQMPRSVIGRPTNKEQDDTRCASISPILKQVKTNKSEQAGPPGSARALPAAAKEVRYFPS